MTILAGLLFIVLHDIASRNKSSDAVREESEIPFLANKSDSAECHTSHASLELC
jgi:hypothetical protein